MTILKNCFVDQIAILIQSNSHFINPLCDEIEVCLSQNSVLSLVQMKSNQKMLYVGR